MATPLQIAAARVVSRSARRPGPLRTRCHVFTGSTNRDGYGQVKVAGVKLLAHRVVYAALVGDPTGCDVHHRCETPACVNPRHLQALPRRDHVRLGDSPAARYARRRTCNYGHPLDGKHRRRGVVTRRCLTCHREEEARRRARLQAA